MNQSSKRLFYASGAALACFALWTLLVCIVDVGAIGPEGRTVGFSALNGAFHRFTGVHMWLYDLTDWLGLVPIAVALGFACLGLFQLIRRRSLAKVDYSIFVLGGFYVVVLLAFLAFEVAIVNYRPILIEGVAEASYPSSTTLLVTCVMPTAAMQLGERIKHLTLKRCVILVIYAFLAFMVVGRLISGVHWLTDIIGGALLSAGLVLLYAALCRLRKD